MSWGIHSIKVIRDSLVSSLENSGEVSIMSLALGSKGEKKRGEMTWQRRLNREREVEVFIGDHLICHLHPFSIY